MRVVKCCDHSFIPDLITPTGVVLDCGANHGAFSQWLSANTAVQVHAFEPDPRLFPTLPKLPRVIYHNMAISAENGQMTLNLGEGRCSSLYYSEDAAQNSCDVKTTSLESFCTSKGLIVIELLKLDIEGAEIPVLLSAAPAFLHQIKQITVEFHDFIDNADLPRIKDTILRLEELGFYGVRFSHFTYGDMLFLNKNMVSISWIDRIQINLFGKYLPGVRRFIRGKIGLKSKGM